MQLFAPHFSFPKRIAYLAVSIVVFLAAYYVGASIPMTEDDANELATQFQGQVKDIDMAGIFMNNAKASLGMFVPGFGAGLGVYTAVSTGMVFNAFAISYPQELGGLSPLAVLATPFGVLEIFAYGLAMSRSGMLVYQLAKRVPWREYVLPTAIEVGIVIVVLIIGAASEFQIIAEP